MNATQPVHWRAGCCLATALCATILYTLSRTSLRILNTLIGQPYGRRMLNVSEICATVILLPIVCRDDLLSYLMTIMHLLGCFRRTLFEQTSRFCIKQWSWCDVSSSFPYSTYCQVSRFSLFSIFVHSLILSSFLSLTVSSQCLYRCGPKAIPRHAQCMPGLQHAGAHVLRGLPRGDRSSLCPSAVAICFHLRLSGLLCVTTSSQQHTLSNVE
jgi:hypothetical protein